MKTSISNSKLTIAVNHHGAELSSITDAKGLEYLWQADPAIWPRQAPQLFPIIGKLKNDSFKHKGETYSLSSHGLARDMKFELVSQSENSLHFQLLATDETRLNYPFEFSLSVSYHLHENSLMVSYEIENNGDELMPFSLGAHPGFALSWEDGDQIEDYYLEFENKETLRSNLLNDDVLMTSDTNVFLDDEKILPITKNLFDHNSLNILAHNLKEISLRSKTSDHCVTVDVSGFPQLGLWSKPAAAYICIEPWLGHADSPDTNGDIMDKAGIVKLAANKIFTCSYSIEIS